MNKYALILLLPITIGCGGVRHVATVTVLSSHAVLAQTQDTADVVPICGADDAPSTPACLPADVRNGAIARALVQAFTLDQAVLSAVRYWPGPPATLDVTAYLTQITRLVTEIVAALPDGAAKTKLLALIGEPR